MSDINRVILIGRLTDEPALKFTQGGAAIANFSLAVNRNYKTATGEKKDEVSFFSCIVWGKLGEVMAAHCRKGRRIGIEGRLQQQRWKDKNDGSNRSKIEIVVEGFNFLDSAKSEDGHVETSGAEVRTDGHVDVQEQAALSKVLDNPFADGDNEIPF